MEVKELVESLLWLAKDTEFVFAADTLRDSASALESMQEELDRVKAERDAAVEDLQIHGGCGICKHGYYEPVLGGICCDTKPKNGWISNKNGQKINRCIIFEWRGLEGRTSHE